jgi:hypothetical protein
MIPGIEYMNRPLGIVVEIKCMILIFVKLPKAIGAFQGIKERSIFFVMDEIVRIEINRCVGMEKPDPAKRIFFDIYNIVATQSILFPVIVKF